MPVSGGQFKWVYLQNAAVATADGASLYVTTTEDGGYAVACFQVSGTFVATVSFEGTIDGTNWVAWEVESVGNRATLGTSAAAAGIFRAVVLG